MFNFFSNSERNHWCFLKNVAFEVFLSETASFVLGVGLCCLSEIMYGRHFTWQWVKCYIWYSMSRFERCPYILLTGFLCVSHKIVVRGQGPRFVLIWMGVTINRAGEMPLFICLNIILHYFVRYYRYIRLLSSFQATHVYSVKGKEKHDKSTLLSEYWHKLVSVIELGIFTSMFLSSRVWRLWITSYIRHYLAVMLEVCVTTLVECDVYVLYS